MLRLFSIALGLLCLLEATVMPACSHKLALEMVQKQHKEETGCCSKEDRCEKRQNESDKCNTACSPLQSCGCCKISFSGVLAMLVFSVPVERNFPSELCNWTNIQLPDNIIFAKDRPPKT